VHKPQQPRFKYQLALRSAPIAAISQLQFQCYGEVSISVTALPGIKLPCKHAFTATAYFQPLVVTTRQHGLAKPQLCCLCKPNMGCAQQCQLKLRQAQQFQAKCGSRISPQAILEMRTPSRPLTLVGTYLQVGQAHGIGEGRLTRAGGRHSSAQDPETDEHPAKGIPASAAEQGITRMPCGKQCGGAVQAQHASTVAEQCKHCMQAQHASTVAEQCKHRMQAQHASAVAEQCKHRMQAQHASAVAEQCKHRMQAQRAWSRAQAAHRAASVCLATVLARKATP